MFRSLCGTDSYQNIIVLTTFWDCVDSAKGVEREGQLKTKAFEDIVAGGGRSMRHDGTAESARKVLEQIIPLPPDIREEMKEAQRKGDQALKELREERDHSEKELAGWKE